MRLSTTLLTLIIHDVQNEAMSHYYNLLIFIGPFAYLSPVTSSYWTGCKLLIFIRLFCIMLYPKWGFLEHSWFLLFMISKMRLWLMMTCKIFTQCKHIFLYCQIFTQCKHIFLYCQIFTQCKHIFLYCQIFTQCKHIFLYCQIFTQCKHIFLYCQIFTQCKHIFLYCQIFTQCKHIF